MIQLVDWAAEPTAPRLSSSMAMLAGTGCCAPVVPVALKVGLARVPARPAATFAAMV